MDIYIITAMKMEKNWTYYLIDPWIYGGKMALKYIVKDWEVWRITVYNRYGRVETVYDRKKKLEILKRMEQSERYWDYEDCFYEDAEWFKERIERWKKMD